MTNGLEFRPGCLCAGTGCGGHLVLARAKWQAMVPVSMEAYADIFGTGDGG